MKKMLRIPLAGCLLAALAAAPAMAQNADEEHRVRRDREEQSRDANADDRRDERPSRFDLRDRRDEDRRNDAWQDQREDDRDARRSRRRGRDEARGDRSSQQDSQQPSQSSDSRSPRAQSAGWIAVAYDYNGDGFYDGVDWIYYYDLQDAKRRSESRARAEEESRRQGRGNQQQANSRQNRGAVRLRGEVVSLETKNVMGSSSRDDAPHQFARIKTESGRTARVCLGKEDRLAELDIREGDRVSIEGVPVQIDDQAVLLARRVSTGGDSITNELPRQERWRRLDGRVRSISYTSSGEREERHTVVKIKAPQGRVVQIDLGPSADIEQLDVQEGDEIAVLGRDGQIDDEALLIAQLVRVGDETVDVRESTNRSLRSARQRDRQQRRPLRDRWSR